MKKIITIKSALIAALAFLLISTSAFAQAPQKISYQAVIRDNNSKLVSNQKVGMQISILQGTATGTSVYKETQTPTSNDNGLVSIEIGFGNIISGDFTTIDWANGPYFIKTETDPSGGANYTIAGTSQLVSVPYSLHANTSQHSETADSALHANTADSALHANTTDSIVGGLIDSTDIANMGFVAGTGEYSIGDFAQGGIVFWVDATGQHGIVCAKEDQSSLGIQWYNGTSIVTNAVRDGVGAGEFNTERIIANQGAGAYAAQISANYQGGNYGDWYLPSKEELNQMYQNKAAINATATANGGVDFASDYYWSSNENTSKYFKFAWMQSFDDGSQSSFNEDAKKYVRAVRAF